MRKRYVIRGWLLLVAVLAVFIGGAGVAYGDEGAPPEAHQAIIEYTGPETCALCHMNVAQDVAESLHYQHQAPAPFREGWEEGVLGGMYVTY